MVSGLEFLLVIGYKRIFPILEIRGFSLTLKNAHLERLYRLLIRRSLCGTEMVISVGIVQKINESWKFEVL